MIHPAAVIDKNVQLGQGVVIREFAIIRSGVKLADGVKIGNFCILAGEPLEIGERTRLNAYVYISNGVTIGKDCFIGPRTTVLNVRFPQATNPEFREKIEPVFIEDRVKIGAHCIILPGLTIGHDALVAAGSTVTKSVEPCMIVRGAPARVVGDIRDLEAYK
jgi:acetyltransferase-like isoleucine patch superfamily enzyme